MKNFVITPQNAAEYADKIIAWIKQKLASANSSGVVLGLSGGIDSAVVAYLCKRGRIPLHMLMLPDGDNPMEDARLVLDDLGMEADVVDIAPLATMVEEPIGDMPDMARINIRPRLRMIMLYALAGKHGALVAGTGNMSEIFTGYFTKWGDGASDFMPLANLTKGEVWTLARELSIPSKIVDKAPSADLFHGQTDESEMGFSYQQIDSFLLSGSSGDEAVDERLRARNKVMEHKNSAVEKFCG